MVCFYRDIIVPKWIGVINSLQEYIFKKNGLESKSYLFFASQLENDFIRNNLTILSEYGVPNSAIRKLKDYIHSDFDEKSNKYSPIPRKKRK